MTRRKFALALRLAPLRAQSETHQFQVLMPDLIDTDTKHSRTEVHSCRVTGFSRFS